MPTIEGAHEGPYLVSTPNVAPLEHGERHGPHVYLIKDLAYLHFRPVALSAGCLRELLAPFDMGLSPIR